MSRCDNNTTTGLHQFCLVVAIQASDAADAAEQANSLCVVFNSEAHNVELRPTSRLEQLQCGVVYLQARNTLFNEMQIMPGIKKNYSDYTVVRYSLSLMLL